METEKRTARAANIQFNSEIIRNGLFAAGSLTFAAIFISQHIEDHKSMKTKLLLQLTSDLELGVIGFLVGPIIVYLQNPDLRKHFKS